MKIKKDGAWNSQLPYGTKTKDTSNLFLYLLAPEYLIVHSSSYLCRS